MQAIRFTQKTVHPFIIRYQLSLMLHESLGAYHSTDIALSAHQKSRCPPALQVQRIAYTTCYCEYY